LDKLHDKYPNYFLLMSECCQGFEKNSVPPKLVTLGDWNNAVDYAHVVMNVSNYSLNSYSVIICIKNFFLYIEYVSLGDRLGGVESSPRYVRSSQLG
jgi:hypothetical protein